MNRIRKNAVGWFTAVLVFLLAFPARGEFSPAFRGLLSAPSVQTEWTCEILDLSGFHQESLTALQDGLKDLKLTLTGNRDGGSALTLRRQGETLLSVSEQYGAEDVLTVFQPSGTGYVTAGGQKSALSLLAGETTVIPDPARWIETYKDAAFGLFEVLEEAVPGNTVKKSTSIKNADSSPAYREYVLDGDGMNSLWPEIAEALLVWMGNGFPAASQPEKTEAVFREMRFSGECRFKRFLDPQGRDMGLQFTGRVNDGNEDRKITLFGGFTEGKGGYFSLSLPAVKGKNNLKLTCSWKLTGKKDKNTLTASAELERRENGLSSLAEFKLTLNNIIKADTEAWTGEAKLTLNRDGWKTVYQLSPDLTLTGDELTGSVELLKKNGSKTALKAGIALAWMQADREEALTPDTTLDLRGLTDAEARAKVLPEMNGMAVLLTRWLSRLPEETRNHLTHDLRPDTWMTASAAPVPGEREWIGDTDENEWIVEEETE